jgi:hypothetical protein
MRILLLSFLLVFTSSCKSQAKLVADTKIAAHYQSWVAGVRGGGSGINFYVDLKTALNEEIELKRVIFKGYEESFEQQDNLHYSARIKTEGNQQKAEGQVNTVILSKKNNTKLASNEAILIFIKNNKEYAQKISNVIEKPALEYPATKPKF